MKLLIFTITAVMAVGLLGSTIALGVLYNKSRNEFLDLKETLANTYSPEDPYCPPPKPEPEPKFECIENSREANITKSFVRVIKSYVNNKLMVTAPLYKKIAESPAGYKDGLKELQLLLDDFYLIQRIKPQFDKCFVDIDFTTIMDGDVSYGMEVNFKKSIKALGTNWVPNIDVNNMIGFYHNPCDSGNGERVNDLVGLVSQWVNDTSVSDAEKLAKMNGENYGEFQEAQEEFAVQNFKLEKFLDIKRSFELSCKETVISEKNMGTFTPGGSFNGTTIVKRSKFLQDQVGREFVWQKMNFFKS